MNWYKLKKEAMNKEVNLFDPEFQRKYKEDIYRIVFRDQDEMAAKSEVFKNILLSEIKDDPEERYVSTNSPKSKTRNALITRSVYQSQEEWEEDLLRNPFYKI